MNFVDRMDLLMNERHEKRAEFCRNAGIKESTIRGWIKGQTPNVELALIVADYFGVSVKWLFTGEGEEMKSSERKLIQSFRKLDDTKQKIVQIVSDSLNEC